MVDGAIKLLTTAEPYYAKSTDKYCKPVIPVKRYGRRLRANEYQMVL